MNEELHPELVYDPLGDDLPPVVLEIGEDVISDRRRDEESYHYREQGEV